MGKGKHITRDFVAKKAWAEFLNKKNSSITRQRYMFLACHLYGYLKLAPPMPSTPDGKGGVESPDLNVFDAMMQQIEKMQGGGNGVSTSRPERREEVRTGVGQERDQDDSGLDFPPIRD